MKVLLLSGNNNDFSETPSKGGLHNNGQNHLDLMIQTFQNVSNEIVVSMCISTSETLICTSRRLDNCEIALDSSPITTPYSQIISGLEFVSDKCLVYPLNYPLPTKDELKIFQKMFLNTPNTHKFHAFILNDNELHSKFPLIITSVGKQYLLNSNKKNHTHKSAELLISEYQEQF